jgi:hypothetical protein
MCTMIWETQIGELILLAQLLEVKKFHILDGVVLAGLLLTLVSFLSPYIYYYFLGIVWICA